MAIAILAGGLGDASAEAVSADVSVALTGAPNPVRVRRQLTYTIVVTNAGPGAAPKTGIGLVPPAVGPRVTIDGPPGAVCTGTGQAVVCTLGQLASGERRIVKAIVLPTTPGAALARAVVDSEADDAKPDNNIASTTTTVLPPLKLLFKLVDRRPKYPLAGSKFYANLQVRRSDTGELLSAGKVTCLAKVAGKRLTLLQHDSYPVPSCLWHIPFRTRGKMLRGSIGVTFEGISVTRKIALRIR